MQEKKTSKELIRTVKFVLFSISAGVIQIGSFTLLNELLQQGFPAEIDDDGPFIQVRVGEYDSLEDAAVMERRLRRAGYDTLIVRN